MLNIPDVLGKVLSEAVTCLEESAVAYTVQSVPLKAGDENKTKRIIRQRNRHNKKMTELLIAYF